MKVGIIGCGCVSGKHLPELAKIPEAQVVAFCDLDIAKAEAAAKQYGTPDAKCYTDYHELLADPEIDNVRVLTWNPTHCEITVAALRAGKHVLCEKPMALTEAEAQMMIDAAKEAGKVLTIGYQHRYDPDVQYSKSVVDAGELGDIYFAKARVLWQRKMPVWRNLCMAEHGGGSFIDIGTHALDTVLWLMDNYKPKYVSATMYHAFGNRPDCGNVFGKWEKGSIDVEDSGFAFLVMENGATILFETAYTLNTSEETNSIQYMLCGTRAGIDNFGEVLKMTGDAHDMLYVKTPKLAQGGVSYVSAGGGTTAGCEEHNFLAATQGKAELTVKPEQAAVVVKILEGIYASAKSGKPYYFE